MSKLTEKQQLFVQGIAAGLKHIPAAVSAGYSATSARVTASQLMARPDIKAAVKAARKKLGQAAPKASPDSGRGNQGNDDRSQWLKDHYDSPLDMHEDVMNNPAIPFAIRMEAAKQAMPYRHAKIGEKGKKEKTKETAAEIANGTNTPFRKRQAPNMHLVK